MQSSCITWDYIMYTYVLQWSTQHIFTYVGYDRQNKKYMSGIWFLLKASAMSSHVIFSHAAISSDLHALHDWSNILLGSCMSNSYVVTSWKVFGVVISLWPWLCRCKLYYSIVEVRRYSTLGILPIPLLKWTPSTNASISSRCRFWQMINNLPASFSTFTLQCFTTESCFVGQLPRVCSTYHSVTVYGQEHRLHVYVCWSECCVWSCGLAAVVPVT